MSDAVRGLWLVFALTMVVLLTCGPTLTTPTVPVSPTSTPAIRGTRLVVATSDGADRVQLTVTSPVGRGAKATATARTTPGSTCAITVRYPSGPSEAAGLDQRTADALGSVSWSWLVGTRTTPGAWEVEVSCIDQQGRSSSGRAVLTVIGSDPPHPSAEAGP